MTRWVVLLGLLLFAVPASAADFRKTTDATGPACTLGVGTVCYARFTNTDTTANIQTDSCQTVKVRFWSNIADAADHDATLTVYDVPKGVTAGTDSLARAITYRDAAGTAQTALTGDDSTGVGRGSIFGIEADGIAFIATVPSAQTALVSVECR